VERQRLATGISFAAQAPDNTAMRVAAIQMTSGHDIETNLEQAGRFLADAARLGASLAALPENFAFMGKDSGDKRTIAEPDGAGRIQNFLADTARRLKIWIVGGTVPLRQDADGRVSASCLVYDANGQRAARYDKMHLFDVDVPGSSESHRESAHTVAGHEARVVDTPAGKMGLAVCYDMRFPELFRVMSRQGAEMFVVPSAFTVPTGRAHWESLLRARAIENLSGLIAPAQWGVHPSGRETFGDSMIIDHWGKVLARMPGGTGCVVADIDAAARMDARTRFPALEHRVIYNT
jgi:nitrilase